MQLHPRATTGTYDTLCIVALLIAAIICAVNAYAPIINGWLR